jgi:RNA 2',3'-cyclic 3'-phosphodiesterase
LTPSSSGSVRLFVALDLPDVLRGHLLGWGAHALSDIPGVRLQRPEAMHVTLCFLGEQPVGEVEAIAGVMHVAVGRRVAVTLTPGAPTWLPARRPRVAAVEVADGGGELAVLQGDVSAGLTAGGWYEPERRPFFAHVTVARIGRNGPRQPPELPAPPRAVSAIAGSVSLYRSHIGPSGARYEAVATVELVSDDQAGSGLPGRS